MTLPQAIAEVRTGHAQRIAAPGQWKVWRDADGVHHLNLKEPRHDD